MQVTFLIGNGFDLNLGLKTNYSDFLKEYQKEQSSDSEVILNFKADIVSEEKLWSAAESQFGKYTSAFKDKGYNAEHFWECYSNFCRALGNYLLEESDKMDFKKSSDVLAKKFSSSIQNFLNGFKEQQLASIKNSFPHLPSGFNFRFLSFNYTKTLDSFINLVQKKNDMLGIRTVGSSKYQNTISLPIHVHGYIHHEMVFGVNDDSQISDISLFDGYDEVYINQLIKIKTNEMHESNTDNKAFELLKQSDLIYIYGMSFGETDALWWQRICEIMKNKPNLHLILHCHDVPTDDCLAFDFQFFSKKKKEDFLKYCSYDEPVKTHIGKQIHICRSNLFSELTGYAGKQFTVPKVF